MAVCNEYRDVLSHALGLYSKRAKNPTRNRTAHNTGNPVTSGAHGDLTRLGFLVRDPAEDYGRMRVYRVTEAGAAEIGRKLQPRFRYVPAAVPGPTYVEPMRLAA